MKTDPPRPPHRAHRGAAPAVRNLSTARQWLPELLGDAVKEIIIQEPPRAVGGGLAVVRAAVVRQDGVAVNVEVLCVDDRKLRPEPVDLFPLPPSVVLGGPN